MALQQSREMASAPKAPKVESEGFLACVHDVANTGEWCCDGASLPNEHVLKRMYAGQSACGCCELMGRGVGTSYATGI